MGNGKMLAKTLGKRLNIELSRATPKIGEGAGGRIRLPIIINQMFLLMLKNLIGYDNLSIIRIILICEKIVALKHI